MKFKKIFQIFFFGKCLSKYQTKKANILNYIFYHFEFVVCFVPLLHEGERNIIPDLSSIAASMKSKLESRDTPTRRIWLCEDPHSSVVGIAYVHVLRTLSHGQTLVLNFPKMRVRFIYVIDASGGLSCWIQLTPSSFSLAFLYLLFPSSRSLNQLAPGITIFIYNSSCYFLHLSFH